MIFSLNVFQTGISRNFHTVHTHCGSLTYNRLREHNASIFENAFRSNEAHIERIDFATIDDFNGWTINLTDLILDDSVNNLPTV